MKLKFYFGLATATLLAASISEANAQTTTLPDEAIVVNHTNDRTDFEIVGCGLQGSHEVGMAIQVKNDEAGAGHTLHTVRTYLTATPQASNHRLVVMKPSKSDPTLPGETVYTLPFEPTKGLNEIVLPDEVAMPDDGFVGILLTETHAADVSYNDSLPLYLVNMGARNLTADIYTEQGTSSWMHLGKGNAFNKHAFPIYAVLTGGTFANNKGYDGQMTSLELPERLTVTNSKTDGNFVFKNNGYKTLRNYTVHVKVNGKEIFNEKYDTPLLNNGRMEGKVSLPIEASGLLDVEIYADELNGSHADENSSNDIASTNVLRGEAGKEYFQRNALLELFSTEVCSNCPEQDTKLIDMLHNEDNWILVGHHAGFGTDGFTIRASQDLLGFQANANSSPMMMMDRSNDTTFTKDGFGIMNMPVLFTADMLKNRTAVFSTIAIDPEISVDEPNRKVKIKINIDSRSNPFLQTPRLTVYVVEDSIASKTQLGHTGVFIHHNVLRKCLTASMGDEIAVGEKDGIVQSKEYVYEIPEKVDASQLHVIAFVSNYNAADINDCEVENAAQKAVPWTDHTGIQARTNDENYRLLATDGALRLEGEFTEAVVYDLTGRTTAQLTPANSTAKLRNGLYLVRISANGSEKTLKVQVR